LLIAFSEQFSVLIIYLILGIIAAIIARLPARPVAKRLLRINTFMLLVVLFVPATTAGSPLFTTLSIQFSREGLLWAVMLTLKANGIILLFTALLGTIELFTLGHAFHHLRVPGKLVHLFMFTLRYLDVLHHEYESLLRAMKTRAFRPRMSLRTYGSYGNLLAMVLVRSLERSERIMAAMKCRGFKGQFHVYRRFVLQKHDLLFSVVAMLIVIGLGLAEIAYRVGLR
jgi:cobalt/nickel transport system permease protein